MTATTIIIPKSKKKPNFDNIDEVLDRIKYLLTFFHYIEFEKVNFKDNHYKVVYADNILYITSDDYEIAGNVWHKGGMLIGDISLFYIKKENINIVGKFNYDLHSDKLILEGSYDAYHINGKFKAVKEKHDVEFIVNSNEFTDLKTFIDKIPMKKKLNMWITEKIKAEEYRLYSLSGKGKVHSSSFTPDLHSLKGDALLKNVKINYKEGLSPVKARKIVLHYEDDTLYFKPTDPTYEKRKIKANSVSISNIGKGRIARLNLDMEFNTVIDAAVQKILKAYHLNIPVLFQNGKSKVQVKLGIPLKKMPKRKIDVYVKADFGKGDLYLKKVKFPVQRGDIVYEKGLITLKDIKLKSSWYEGVVNGKIYTKAKKADIVFSAKKIEIGKGKEKVFALYNKKIPVTVYYDKKITVSLPTYKITLNQNKENTHIAIQDITKLTPFLKQFSIGFDGGRMELWTKDFKYYTFRGELLRHACFIYSDNVCYTRIPCSGSFDTGGIEFYAFGKRIHYSTQKSRITLKNLNIDLEKFFDSKTYKKNNAKIQSKKVGKLFIKGINSRLRYGKYTLLTDSYSVNIYFPSGTIRAKGKLGSDVVTFNKKGNHIAIEALRIHDKMLHPLINFNGLQKGRYTIKISGTPGKLMKGEILLDGGILKSFTAYNKTRNFIKNNKELAQIQDSGFTANGFKIRKGKITYRIVKNKVIFDSVYIKGDTATIVGTGTLNIQTKKLNINLAIQTVRKLGKLVGSLPVLGYILMGEDNSITFGLKITGTLDNPKVETSAAKEILMLPFDLIKRTLQSPAHIINTGKKEKKITVPTVETVTIPQNRVSP